MPTLPSIVERALMRAGLLPPFASDFTGAVALRAYAAAERLGLFETLRGGPHTAAELGAKAGADAALLEALCDVLVSAGYLRRARDRYANAPLAERWIVSGKGMPDLARYWSDLVFGYWDSLEDALRAGLPTPHLHQYLDRTGGWPIFSAAMAEIAARSADDVARAVHLPEGARRIVDVGGSHALYAIALCRRHPHLQATIVDLPQALWAARERVAAAQLGSRVEVRALDVSREPLGGPYDAALLFQVLHGFSPERNADLLRRVREALAPGGVVAILDQTAVPRAPLGRALASALRLAYRTGLGGDLYPYEEVVAWLRGARFVDVRRRSLRSAPGNDLITAARGA